MTNNKKTVAYYTLGCKLNFSETSTIARQLEELGFTRVQPTAQADLYVINTCSVTQQADRKCRQAIRKFTNLSPNAFIAVVGCYSQLKPDEIASIPGVDLVLGTSERDKIPLYLHNLDKKAKAKVYSCEHDAITDFFPAYSSADRTRSFLKVQDGCSYKCAYCTIPLARGESRNIPIARVIEQAQEIANMGVKEIVITGVNTGDFGRTTGETFLGLIQRLDQVKGIERYRISSIEPNLITEEIIEFTARSEKFMPHFHIPLQAGSDSVLASMGRRYKSGLFTQRVNQIMGSIPNAFIGVDVIVGFPGETESDFEQTHALLSNLKPSFIHVFPYSPRPGTRAATMPNPVKASIVKQRAAKLQELSIHLQREFYTRHIGSEEFVLFEGGRSGTFMHGFTGNYIKVKHPYSKELVGQIVKVNLIGINPQGSMDVSIL